jgi:hypothetical protein
MRPMCVWRAPHQCAPDRHRVARLPGWYGRIRSRQNPVAAGDLARLRRRRSGTHKNEVAHTMHTVWRSSGTRRACFGISSAQNSALQNRRTVAQIHCGHWILLDLVRVNLWITRIPQVSHWLALRPVTNRRERMYYRVRSLAPQSIRLISRSSVLAAQS